MRGTASSVSGLTFQEPPEKKVRRGRRAGSVKAAVIHQLEAFLLSILLLCN